MQNSHSLMRSSYCIVCVLYFLCIELLVFYVLYCVACWPLKPSDEPECAAASLDNNFPEAASTMLPSNIGQQLGPFGPTGNVNGGLDRSQSLFYFVPQENSHSQAGSTSAKQKGDWHFQICKKSNCVERIIDYIKKMLKRRQRWAAG